MADQPVLHRGGSCGWRSCRRSGAGPGRRSGGVDGLQELQELLCRCWRWWEAMTWPVATLSAANRPGRAVADVVVAAPGGVVAGSAGTAPCGQSPESGSSHPRTGPRRARAGPCTADDVADLSMNCGSVDSFHVSCTCGFRPNARQIPRDSGLIQARRLRHRPGRPLRVQARRLILQRLHDHLLDPLVGDLPRCPGRGSSARPSSLLATNRARHLPTICGVTPSRPATSCSPSPPRTPATIFDRSASACALFGRRAHRSRTAARHQSALKAPSGGQLLPSPSLPILTELMTQDTSSHAIWRQVRRRISRVQHLPAW